MRKFLIVAVGALLASSVYAGNSVSRSVNAESDRLFSRLRGNSKLLENFTGPEIPSAIINKDEMPGVYL